jgi:hypothetical protein
MKLLLCSYPFPKQDPPPEASAACDNCRNADPEARAGHATIAPDDPELLAAIRSFTDWLLEPGEAEKDGELIRRAAELYVREDHDGMCIPKNVFFAMSKLQQFGAGEWKLSERGRGALVEGAVVNSWPDKRRRRAQKWAFLFRWYNRRYDAPM